MRVFVGRDPALTVRDDAGKVLRQGPPIHRSRVFVGGKRDAQRALEAFVEEIRKAGAHSKIGASATFGRLLDEWMDKVISKRARSTVETYGIHIRKHIRPALGGVKLSALGSYELDAYYNELRDKGLSDGTIKLEHSIIRSALSQGEAWGWIASNPAKKASPGGEKTKRAPTLTLEQLSKLYQAAAREDEDMAAAIALGALTGCRRGELCGLQWGDVDWKRGAIRVERAWVPVEGGQELTQTKTGKERTVFVGAEGIRVLREYEKAKTHLLGRKPAPNGWLLSMDGGETPLRAKALTEYVANLGRRTKVKIRLHSLRHFRATELVHAGVDLPTAAGQMGHTPAVMAETYLHTSDERGAAAGELVSAAIGRALELPAAT